MMSRRSGIQGADVHQGASTIARALELLRCATVRRRRPQGGLHQGVSCAQSKLKASMCRAAGSAQRDAHLGSWWFRNDVKASMEGVTLTVGEIRKLRQKDGYYRNPKTGTYTLTSVRPCASCGEAIPAPVPPPSLRQDDFKGVPTVVNQIELRKWEAEQKCPRCGNNVF